MKKEIAFFILASWPYLPSMGGLLSLDRLDEVDYGCLAIPYDQFQKRLLMSETPEGRTSIIERSNIPANTVSECEFCSTKNH